MQADDEYRKAVENQIAMIEEILSRFAKGKRTWEQREGETEWHEMTQENIRRHEEDLTYFRSVRDELDKARREK